MKFLKTDVWRLKVPVFLSAQPRIPLALSIAAAGGDFNDGGCVEVLVDLVAEFGRKAEEEGR